MRSSWNLTCLRKYISAFQPTSSVSHTAPACRAGHNKKRAPPPISRVQLRAPEEKVRRAVLLLADELWPHTTQRQHILSRCCHRSCWRAPLPRQPVQNRCNHDSFALKSRQIKHTALQKSPVVSLSERETLNSKGERSSPFRRAWQYAADLEGDPGERTFETGKDKIATSN